MGTQTIVSRLGMAALLLLLTTPALAQNRETVRFENDGLNFVGDLYLPDAPGPHPAIILLPGSDRGERSKPFWADFAEVFRSEGMAVLVFDKRGVGDSEGEYRESPILDVAARDGVAAVGAIKGREDIDPNRIGVWGVSQGGWLGPLMASMSSDIAFVISLSGPGVSPLEQSLYQRMWELIEDGYSLEDAEALTAVRRLAWKYFQTGEGWEEAQAAKTAAMGEGWFERIGWGPDVPLVETLSPGSTAWFEHAAYDPVPPAETVRVPVLHMFGGKDRHIPVEPSLEALRPAYARAGNDDVTFLMFPEGGHGLQIVLEENECLRKCENVTSPGQVEGYNDSMIEWLAARGMTGSS